MTVHDNFALRLASQNGHLELVKYLVLHDVSVITDASAITDALFVLSDS